jgi:hypothetical protein
VKRYGSVVQSSRIRMQEAPLVRLMKMVEEEKKVWAALYAGHKHPKVRKISYQLCSLNPFKPNSPFYVR